MSGWAGAVAGTAAAGAILALFVFLVARGFRRRPAVAHALWLLVLLRFLVPPLREVEVPWMLGAHRSSPPTRTEDFGPGIPEDLRLDATSIAAALALAESLPPLPEDEAPSAATLAPAMDLTTTADEEPSAPLPWRELLIGLWAAGTIGFLGLATLRARRFGRLLAHASAAPKRIRRRVDTLAGNMGLRHLPELAVIDARISPAIWGIGRRTVLVLPAAIIAELDPESVDTLLVHELAHYRRRDHWIRPLETLVAAIWWWHPGVWLARRELHRFEEASCDAGVTSILPGRNSTYAKTLLKCLDFVTSPAGFGPPVATAMADAGDLKRRIEMIMSHQSPWTLGRRARLALGALALAALPLIPAAAQDEVRVAEITITDEAAEAPAAVATLSDSWIAAVAENGSTNWRAVAPAAAESTCDGIAEEIAGLKKLIRRLNKSGNRDEAALLAKVVKRLEGVQAATPVPGQTAALLEFASRAYANQARTQITPEVRSTDASNRVLESIRRWGATTSPEQQAIDIDRRQLGAPAQVEPSADPRSTMLRYIEAVGAGQAMTVPAQQPPRSIEERLAELENRISTTLDEIRSLREESRPAGDRQQGWWKVEVAPQTQGAR